MEAKEFIINAINDLVAQFENVHVRYEYDNLAIVHTVEVLPVATYKEDKAYIQWESDVMNSFIKEYPYENLCFVSEGALSGIEHIDYEAEGIRYSEPTRVKSDPININPYGLNVSRQVNDFMLSQPYEKNTTVDATQYNGEDYSLAA